MSTTTETFKYDEVKKDIEDLEVYFDDFAAALRKANDAFSTYIGNQDVFNGIYGTYGTKLLNLWDSNASTFGDFKANFDEWVKLITLVGFNNRSFEEYATSATKTMTTSEFNASNYGLKAGQLSLNQDLRSAEIDVDLSKCSVTHSNGFDTYFDENNHPVCQIIYNSDGSIKSVHYNVFKESGKDVEGNVIYEVSWKNYDYVDGKFVQNDNSGTHYRVDGADGSIVGDNLQTLSDAQMHCKCDDEYTSSDLSFSFDEDNTYIEYKIDGHHTQTLTYYGTSNDGVNLYSCDGNVYALVGNKLYKKGDTDSLPVKSDTGFVIPTTDTVNHSLGSNNSFKKDPVTISNVTYEWFGYDMSSECHFYSSGNDVYAYDKTGNFMYWVGEKDEFSRGVIA